MKTIANTAILSEIEMQKIKNATEGAYSQFHAKPNQP
jgi:hypothetical protein